MEKNNKTSPQREAQDDIIELGVASVETKGDLNRQESVGGSIPMGLIND